MLWCPEFRLILARLTFDGKSDISEVKLVKRHDEIRDYLFAQFPTVTWKGLDDNMDPSPGKFADRQRRLKNARMNITLSRRIFTPLRMQSSSAIRHLDDRLRVYKEYLENYVASLPLLIQVLIVQAVSRVHPPHVGTRARPRRKRRIWQTNNTEKVHDEVRSTDEGQRPRPSASLVGVEDAGWRANARCFAENRMSGLAFTVHGNGMRYVGKGNVDILDSLDAGDLVGARRAISAIVPSSRAEHLSTAFKNLVDLLAPDHGVVPSGGPTPDPSPRLSRGKRSRTAKPQPTSASLRRSTIKNVGTSVQTRFVDGD